MKRIICKVCGVEKNEIEFEYDYFRRKYINICSKCKKIKKENDTIK